MTPRVLILGGTGMLGRAMITVFSKENCDWTATTRVVSDAPSADRNRFVAFDVLHDDIRVLLNDLGPGDWVINCIGVIKTYIDDGDSISRLNAIRINAQFPYELSDAADKLGFRIVQIATDCVFSGRTGSYDELADHDAHDVYGQTKSLGEVPSTSTLNLRSSIIGPEHKNKHSLLEWVLSHGPDTSFTGYTDHLWNGVTSLSFSRVTAGIVRTANTISGTHHLVPFDLVSKCGLSRHILDTFGRNDVAVLPTVTTDHIDRTLATIEPELNSRLWRDAGYNTPPTIVQMVAELVPSDMSTNGDSQ